MVMVMDMLKVMVMMENISRVKIPVEYIKEVVDAAVAAKEARLLEQTQNMREAAAIVTGAGSGTGTIPRCI